MRQICCHLQISDDDKKVLGNGVVPLSQIRTCLVFVWMTDSNGVSVNIGTEMIEHKGKELAAAQGKMQDVLDYKRELEAELRSTTGNVRFVVCKQLSFKRSHSSQVAIKNLKRRIAEVEEDLGKVKWGINNIKHRFSTLQAPDKRADSHNHTSI